MNPKIKELLASKIAAITYGLDNYNADPEDTNVSGVQDFNPILVSDVFEYDYYEGMREGIWYVMYLLGEDFVREVNKIIGSIEDEVQEQSQQKVQE